MRIATFATAAGLALLGTVALAKSVTYDYDRAADFSRYKTYSWTRGTELTDELNHARVVRAVDAQLTAKGLTRVDPNALPDVLVAYHASLERSLEIQGFSHGWGPFGLGPDRTGSVRVQPVLVGNLVVDLIDARTNAMVWRAVASSDVNPATTPQKRDQNIAKATEKMFDHYPPKR
jgi:Domain of unknown function (DUF4136)